MRRRACLTAYGCANPVAGAKLLLTASDIQDYSYTRLVLRITYKTVEWRPPAQRELQYIAVPAELKS